MTDVQAVGEGTSPFYVSFEPTILCTLSNDFAVSLCLSSFFSTDVNGG